MNTNNRNPTKKCKVDDGRAVAHVSDDTKNKNCYDEHHANEHFMQRTFSHMERMEQMMTRMEDKLDAISSLESRCEELERKCSSLENKLESTTQSVKDHTDQKFDAMTINVKELCNRLESSMTQSLKDHVDQKFNSMLNNLDRKSSLVDDKIEALRQKTQTCLEYNSMLVKNQSWKYSAAIPPIEQIMSDTDCDYHTAEVLTKEIQKIKENTIEMRRGEFTSEIDNMKFITLLTYLISDQNSYKVTHPHLEEFAAALKQFTPAMNFLFDECDTTSFIINFKMDNSGQMMMKEALMGKPFTSIQFWTNLNVQDGYGGMTADDIITIAESNKHLRKLEITHNHIQDDITNRLCSVVHNHPLLEFSIANSVHDAGVGNAILANLFTNVELKLDRLCMRSAGITSEVSTVLADFLAANPALQFLDLDNNSLEDSDAALIANALRSNTTLMTLGLSENNITRNGFEFFRPVLFNESSLNAVADSNHNCYVYEVDCGVNTEDAIEMNRGRKIFTLLFRRHEEMSNVQYFTDVNVNLLPNMLQAVERYGKIMEEDEEEEEEDDEEYGSDFEAPNQKARSLSIIYEIMRRWEKVFNLYEV